MYIQNHIEQCILFFYVSMNVFNFFYQVKFFQVYCSSSAQALASVSASIAKEDGGENKEYFRPTMAPNSKFLNPHLDDATNLQLAISAFADALDEVDNGELN